MVKDKARVTSNNDSGDEQTQNREYHQVQGRNLVPDSKGYRGGNNRVKGSTDMSNSTEFLVNSVLQGKAYVKHTNVNNIVDKSQDLKKCIKQQRNAMGFLPINDLDRSRFASVCKPKVILTEKEYCPIKTHKVIRATGCYNFQSARIQLPTKINPHVNRKMMCFK